MMIKTMQEVTLMDQEKKPHRPTPQELGKMLQEANSQHQEKAAADPEYKERWERFEKALFGTYPSREKK